MKQKGFILALLCIGLLTFEGCKKDKDSEKMSDLTIDQHKTNLENEGIEFVDDLNAMQDMQSLSALNNMLSLTEPSFLQASTLNKIISQIANLKKEATGVIKIKSTLVEPETLSAEFEQNGGIYTYNSSTKSWIRTAKTDVITLIFPATESSTNNNAELSLSNYTYTTAQYNSESAETTELPKSLKLALSINNVEQISFVMSASYNTDGLPTTSSVALTFIEGYVYTVRNTLSDSYASFDQSFTLNGADLLATHLDFKGNFDYQNIINNANAETDEEIQQQSVINSSNAWFSIKNIKLQGIINYKGWISGMQKIDATTEKEYAKAQASVYNNNLKMYVKYKDSNEIIAKSEFYAFEKDNGYSESYWTNDIRVIFSDGEPFDASYFNESLTNLETTVKDWQTAMETSYGN